MSKYLTSLLDNAQALMDREWNINEPGEEILRQYTIPCGHLTLKQLRQDYMRIDCTLDITPEGSKIKNNIQAMSRWDVDQTKSQQTPETSEQRVVVDQPSTAALDWAAGTLNTSMKVMPRRTPMPFSYDVPG